MKKLILLLTVSLNVAPLLADDSVKNTSVLPNEREQASYAMGMYYGHFLQQRGIDTSVMDPDTMIRGLNDSLGGGPTLLTPQQMSQVLKDFMKDNQQALAANQAKQQQALAAKNQAENTAFFASNGKADGVVTLSDGLQYKIITAGSGPLPAPTDTVTVSYQLSLLDGTAVQSSPLSGIPMPLGSQMIIEGMREALTNMPIGSVWDVWMPPALGYGEQGRGPIPPDTALKFHVQLLGISAHAPPPPQPPAPLTSDIIAVPSAEDISKGKKPYTLTAEQVREMQAQAQTNGMK